MRILLLLLTSSLTVRVAVAAGMPPSVDPTWAEIRLPYEQWQRLWQATQAKPEQETNAPPVAALITSAAYELAANSNCVTLRVEYVTENFTDQWQTLPLLGGDARLASIDSTNATVAWCDEAYALLLRERGVGRVRAEFSLPRSAMREGIRFVPGPASVCSLRVVDISEDQTLEVTGLDSSRGVEDSLVWHFPGSGGEYQLRFTEPRPALAPIQASAWSLASEVFLSVTNGRLHHDCLLHAVATSGSAVEIDVLLPSSAAGIRFSGDDAMEGRVLPASGSHRVLHLRWQTRDIPVRRVELSYSLPAVSSDTLHVVPPRSKSENAGRVIMAIGRVGGRELTSGEAKKIDAARASSWLRKKAGQAVLDWFENQGPARFGVQWLPRIQTARAMIPEAVYESRLVDDGSMLITGKLTIEHRQAVDLSLTMPEFEEVLTGKLNGRATRPIQRSTNIIEFPLPANTNGQSELEFSYAAQGTPFDAVSGRLDLQLPKSELFVHALQWRLDIPDRFETSAIQGNVVFEAKSGKSPHDLQLVKRLVRREHPTVQIHYRRRGLDD